jgi:hypothetical protein
LDRSIIDEVKKLARDLLSPSGTYEPGSRYAADFNESMALLSRLGEIATKSVAPEVPVIHKTTATAIAESAAVPPQPSSQPPAIPTVSCKPEYQAALSDPSLVAALLNLTQSARKAAPLASKTTAPAAQNRPPVAAPAEPASSRSRVAQAGQDAARAAAKIPHEPASFVAGPTPAVDVVPKPGRLRRTSIMTHTVLKPRSS